MSCTDDMTLNEVLTVMMETRVAGMPVLDEAGGLCGALFLSDFRNILNYELLNGEPMSILSALDLINTEDRGTQKVGTINSAIDSFKDVI